MVDSATESVGRATPAKAAIFSVLDWLGQTNLDPPAHLALQRTRRLDEPAKASRPVLLKKSVRIRHFSKTGRILRRLKWSLPCDTKVDRCAPANRPKVAQIDGARSWRSSLRRVSCRSRLCGRGTSQLTQTNPRHCAYARSTCPLRKLPPRLDLRLPPLPFSERASIAEQSGNAFAAKRESKTPTSAT